MENILRAALKYLVVISHRKEPTNQQQLLLRCKDLFPAKVIKNMKSAFQ
jgi:hypothetical protein